MDPAAGSGATPRPCPARAPYPKHSNLHPVFLYMRSRPCLSLVIAATLILYRRLSNSLASFFGRSRRRVG